MGNDKRWKEMLGYGDQELKSQRSTWALGADRSNVVGMVLNQGARLTLAGVAIGIVAALGLTRLIQSLLYQITASDPLTFIGVSLLLVITTILACWLPARRAARVDPIEALRNE